MRIDAKVSIDQAATAETVTSPPFTTMSGAELLLAFISTDYLTGANTTVTGVTGGGLTWVLVGRANLQSGDSEIWRAFAPNSLSRASITAALSQPVVSSMTVVSFGGVDPSGSNGSGAIGAVSRASAASGAPVASLTTTRNNSLVVGVGNDFDNAVTRSPGAGQALLHQYLTAAGDTYWVQTQTSAIAASGTTASISDTAPTGDRYNLAICEILANPSPGNPTWSAAGTISPAAAGNGATLTLSGTASATVIADSSGNYSFSGLSDGSYSIKPSKAGYTFSPVSQSFIVNGANQSALDFTAQPEPAWSISGNIDPAADGSGTSVMLSGATSALMTAGRSGNYSFTGLSNGSYTVTPTKTGYSFTPAHRPVSLNGANASGVNFTAAAPSNALAIDARVSKDQSPASATVTSPAFSTSSTGELLLAFVGTDYLEGVDTTVKSVDTTVKSVAGAGLTWVLVGRANTQAGSSEIWRAFAPAPLSGVTVTATLSETVISSLTVVSFTGADASGTNGSGAIGAVTSASAATGAPAATLTTTRKGSFVIGVGNDFDSATARTPATGQSLLHQYLSTAGDTYWVQMETNPVPVSGTSVSIKDTAPATDQYNLTICEILAGSGGTITPVPPTVTMTAPAPGTIAGSVTLAASASDNVGISSVQFLLDNAPVGATLTTPPYTTAWNSKTVADGSHTLSARAQNTAAQTAAAPPVTVTVNNSGNAPSIGSWSAPVSLPAVAVNLILLPTDPSNVLFYQDGDTPTVWDYVNNTFTNVPIGVNLFCSGASLLADGRVFVAGGAGSGVIGIANAEIFNPATNQWKAVPDMAYKRWYPTATTLSDGRVLVTAGWQTTAHTNAGISEIYNPATNSWTQLKNANNPFETYPFLYQLGDGRVLHIGGSEYATDTDILDIPSQTWSVIDSNIVDGASATMFSPGKFVKAGTATDSQGIGQALNTTFVLDMTHPNPAWQQTASMAYPAAFSI